MKASTREFLSQIIDYAGLFPPARLPLPDALANYLRYRKESPYRWMLGRFVCPAARLAELLPLAQAHPQASLLSLTALGQQGSDVADFFAKLQADIAAVEAFREAWEFDDVIDTMEIPLPRGEDVESRPTWEALYMGYGGAVGHYLHFAADHLENADLRGFVEIPMRTQGGQVLQWDNQCALRGVVEMSAQERWREDVMKVAQGLHSVHDYLGEEARLGLKLRCGGVTAEAFPSDEQIAFFIDRCWPRPLSWKATAGLHHPRRHWDETLQLWHQGFLNVFAAGLLAMAHPLTEADLVAILFDRDASNLRFDDAGFSWKDWTCTTDQIAHFRARGPTSFGSCSFEEPCADLVSMGLIGAGA